MKDVYWRKFSAFRVILWTLAIPMAYFFGWLASVTFVSLCSLYANVASDFAAWRSDVNPHQEQLNRIEEKLNKILENLNG